MRPTENSQKPGGATTDLMYTFQVHHLLNTEALVILQLEKKVRLGRWMIKE